MDIGIASVAHFMVLLYVYVVFKKQQAWLICVKLGYGDEISTNVTPSDEHT
jgi:hypothetical protein